MVSSVSRAWTRSPSAAPLAERGQQVVDELHRIAPEARYTQPMSEPEYDTLVAELERVRKAKAPPPPDPAVQALLAEHWQLKRRINTRLNTLREDQRRLLSNWSTDFHHKIRGTIRADMIVELPAPHSLDGKYPDRRSFLEVQDENRALYRQEQALVRAEQLFTDGRQFDALPSGDKSLELLGIAFAEIKALKADRTALHSAVLALQARLDRLERRRKKPKMQRAA